MKANGNTVIFSGKWESDVVNPMCELAERFMKLDARQRTVRELSKTVELQNVEGDGSQHGKCVASAEYNLVCRILNSRE